MERPQNQRWLLIGGAGVAFALVYLFLARQHDWLRPPPGTFIAILAFVAIIITMWVPQEIRSKAVWFSFCFLLLALEINNLYADRDKHDRDASEERKSQEAQAAKDHVTEDNRFAALMAQQSRSFSSVLDQNQREFATTLGGLRALSRSAESLGKIAQRSLDAVSERENTLFPLGQQSPRPPSENCHPGAMSIFVGTNVFWTDGPHMNVFTLNGKHLLQLDRSPKSDGVQLSFQIFDDKGDIVAHADRNSYWVRSDTRVERPNRGTLAIYDHRDQTIPKGRLPELESHSRFRHPA